MVRSTPLQLARKYCQGGGFLPSDESHSFCVFCKHPFVDEVPVNKHVLSNNLEKEKKFEEQKRHLEDFKAGRKETPPLSSTGRPIKNRIPAVKKESLVLQCHCFQMRCVQEGSDIGSTCELKCCDPST